LTEVGLGQLELGQRGSELIAEDADLARAGLAILDANWLGHATRASSRLYPHQWSWDAACIAIAYSHLDQARAETELRSLFEGQWRNGLLPHIRFTEGARYFPGPEFWQTELSPDAPTRPRTSGIVQPPVHATAVWHVYRNALDTERAEAFLRELLPQLAAWHAYLYRERTRDGEGLVELWHPWESGIDNSPLWDEALARIAPSEEEIPEYKRVDTEVVDSSQRPTNAEYDRYAYLVKCYRERAYDQARIRAECPFAIQDVLFNAILARANDDLASIARIVGEDPEPYERWAELTRSSLDAKLWSEADGMYLDYDLRADAPVAARTWGGLAPLYCGVAPERASRLLRTVREFAVTVDGGWAVASVASDDPSFDPARYWRGPVWPMISWVIHLGLRRHGFDGEADTLRSTQLGLARSGGFWEHYNAKTGEGQGTEHLSWTAAIVLDLLLARPGDTSVLTRISEERS
jgi:mannosylglycerate hydrolase